MNQTTMSKKIQALPLIDTAIDNLRTEAETLSTVIRAYSEKIKEVETMLENLKAHFPYRLLIKKEERSRVFPPTQLQIESTVGPVDGYFTQTSWFLSWEKDDECKDKRFRLYLIAEQEEIILFPSDGRCDEAEFQKTSIYKKAFADTDLKTKLRHSEYLLPFINAFEEFLKQSRIAIEDALPF